MKRIVLILCLLASGVQAQTAARDSAAASNQDGSNIGGTFYIHLTTGLLGNFDGTTRKAAVVFVAPPIPDGVTVDSAFVQFRATVSESSAQCYIRISAEDTASAAVLAQVDTSVINSRVKTTAYVDWTPAAWTSGSDYQTDDIKTVVQEWLDRGDHLNDSSQNLCILFMDNSSTSGHYRQFDTYDDADLATSPKLLVYYSAAAESTVNTKRRRTLLGDE